VAIDSSVTPNRLYVADTNNSRVLGYRNVATFVNGGAADLVMGQPDFISGTDPDVACASPSASNLSGPIGVAVDATGNLYVADSNNSRVLEYSAPFAGCGSFPCVGGSANVVFGQNGNFTTNNCNSGGASANTLCFPVGVAVDSHGNLYVVDQDENRVLEYNSPLTPNAADFTPATAALNPCGATLAGGASCAVGVTFKPRVAAPESASVAISVSPDAASPHNVALTGTGM
jgi:sugar lactone lactonase YvrE